MQNDNARTNERAALEKETPWTSPTRIPTNFEYGGDIEGIVESGCPVLLISTWDNVRYCTSISLVGSKKEKRWKKGRDLLARGAGRTLGVGKTLKGSSNQG